MMHIRIVQARQPRKNKIRLRNIYWKSNTLSIMQESQQSTKTTSLALMEATIMETDWSVLGPLRIGYGC